MHNDQHEQEEHAEAQATFRGELGQAVEFAQNQPTTEEDQANGDKINAPAKKPAQQGNPAAHQPAIVDGEQAKQGDQSDRRP